MEQLEPHLSQLVPVLNWLQEAGPEFLTNIVFALLVFFIGKRVARLITNGVSTALRKNNIEAELVSFVDSLLYWTLFAVVTLAALGQLGIQTASFLAILGAAGLAIGLALQGSLSNFAAGVLIIILRPFGVGDWVEIAGEAGKVQSIRIFTTELRTGDNKCVVIPNSRVLESNIINHSSTGTRRIDLVFGIGYDDDLKKAKAIIESVFSEHKKVLSDPAPSVFLTELGASSVDLAARPWVETADYWSVRAELIEEIKLRFDEAGITIPYPHTTLTYAPSTQSGETK